LPRRCLATMQPLNGVARTTDERRRVKIELGLLVVGLAVLVLAAVPTRGQNVPASERWLFRVANDLPGWVYPPIWPVMQVGNGLAPVVVALAALLWHRYRLASGLAFAGLAVYLLDKVVKAAVPRHRPPELLSGVHVHGALATGNGFPSGHAAVAFALATIAWLWFGPRIRWVFLAVAIAVAVARVYVGAHLPLDVFAGAGLGTGVGAFVGLLLSIRRYGNRSRPAA
jgi:membrane-associated phospholipid phosphatase